MKLGSTSNAIIERRQLDVTATDKVFAIIQDKDSSVTNHSERSSILGIRRLRFYHRRLLEDSNDDDDEPHA